MSTTFIVPATPAHPLSGIRIGKWKGPKAWPANSEPVDRIGAHYANTAEFRGFKHKGASRKRATK